jgi:hypothetical protein
MAAITWSCLVYLKVKDIWQNKENGPIRFMLSDNRRRGIWMLALSFVAVRIGYIGVTEPPYRFDYEEMRQSFESMAWMNAIVYGLVIEAFFTYRRREKMAYLVAKYGGIIGGKRYTDPQVPRSAVEELQRGGR